MEPDAILPYARPADPTAPLTARGAATVACRLIALWLFAQSAQQLLSAITYFVSMLFDSRGGRMAILSYGPVALLVIASPIATGWLLWAAAGWIARRVVPDDVAIAPTGGPGLLSLITVGLVMVGASTVVWAAHDLVGAAVVASQTRATFALWWHDPNWLRAVGANGVLLGLSAWLIFGGRGVVDLVHRARTAGLATPPVPVDQPAA